MVTICRARLVVGNVVGKGGGGVLVMVVRDRIDEEGNGVVVIMVDAVIGRSGRIVC